jgi:hypothetical protein
MRGLSWTVNFDFIGVPPAGPTTTTHAINVATAAIDIRFPLIPLPFLADSRAHACGSAA